MLTSSGYGISLLGLSIIYYPGAVLMSLKDVAELNTLKRIADSLEKIAMILEALLELRKRHEERIMKEKEIRDKLLKQYLELHLEYLEKPE